MNKYMRDILLAVFIAIATKNIHDYSNLRESVIKLTENRKISSNEIKYLREKTDSLNNVYVTRVELNQIIESVEKKLEQQDRKLDSQSEKLDKIYDFIIKR